MGRISTVVTGAFVHGVSRLTGGPAWTGVTCLITLRCNLSCAYCDFPRHAFTELATQQWLELLSGLRSAGTIHLGISGGEPLLRDDVGEIIRKAREIGFIVSLVTNGILVEQRLDDTLAADYLLVTIEGPEDVHDHKRGVGSYRAAVSGLTAASRAKKSRLGIIVPVHAANLAHIEHPLRLAVDVGARVYYQPVQIRNGFAGPLPDGVLSWDQVAETFQRIRLLKSEGWPVGSSDPFLDMMVQPHPPSFQRDCPAGRHVVTILPDGRVLPCCMVPFETGISITDLKRPLASCKNLKPPSCSGCSISPYVENYLLLKPDIKAWMESLRW